MPYRCKDCRKHFSVMSHTVMHQSKLGCQTCLLALFSDRVEPEGAGRRCSWRLIWG